MYLRRLPTILILMAMAAGYCAHRASGGPLPTVAELLKQHGIQLTQPALVDALESADPQVRYLAAQQLAENKATEVIPTIIKALSAETVPWTRMNIAFALAQLGAPVGFSSLESSCRDRGVQEDVKTQSAEYLLILGRDSAMCRSMLLEILQTGSNGYRMQAASILSRSHSLSAEDSESIYVGLVQALHVADASVRMAAGSALADMGDSRAIAELTEAAAREPEQAVRLQLEQDVKILKEKPRR